MAFNKVKLSQIIKDFIITLDGDDYASNASDSAIRNFALRGIREIGFDLGKKVKSLKRSVNSKSVLLILVVLCAYSATTKTLITLARWRLLMTTRAAPGRTPLMQGL
jgi:hypothetical protein